MKRAIILSVPRTVKTIKLVQQQKCLNCSKEISSPDEFHRQINIISNNEQDGTTLPVKDIISSLYNLKYLNTLPNNLAQVEDDSLIGVCGSCNLILVNLYKLFTMFNDLRNCDSYLNDQIKRLDECMSLVNNKSPLHTQQIVNNKILYGENDRKIKIVAVSSIKPEKNVDSKMTTNKNMTTRAELNKDPVTNDFEFAPVDSDIEEEPINADPLQLDEDVPLLSRLASSESKAQPKRGRPTKDKDNIFYIHNGLKIEEINMNSATEQHFATGGPEVCPFCKKTFRESYLLSAHLKLHGTESPYKCPHCPKTFSKESEIFAHYKKHQNSKSFHCLTCGKSFSYKSELLKDVEGHENKFKSAEKKCHIRCPLCTHVAKTAKAWSVHVGTHGDWECSVCKRACKTKANFELHEKRREKHLWFAQQENPTITSLTCRAPSCSAQFCTHMTWKEHEEAHPSKPFSCPTCEVRFSVEWTQKNHSRNTCPGRELVCPIPDCPEADIIFGNHDLFLQHLIPHARMVEKIPGSAKQFYECPICFKITKGMGFMREHLLRLHIAKAAREVDRGIVKKNKILERQCKVCKKILKTVGGVKHHMRVAHMKVKKFPCGHCGDAFTKEIVLIRHVEKFHSKKLKVTGGKASSGQPNKSFISVPAKSLEKSMDTHTQGNGQVVNDDDVDSYEGSDHEVEVKVEVDDGRYY